MDIIAKAAAKGEDLRKGGWYIKGVRVSQRSEVPDLEPRPILILKMTRIAKEQMQNLHVQVTKDGWWVLFDFGVGYESTYPPEVMNKLKGYLDLNHPMMVWESAAERRGRLSTSSVSSRRSGT